MAGYKALLRNACWTLILMHTLFISAVKRRRRLGLTKLGTATQVDLHTDRLRMQKQMRPNSLTPKGRSRQSLVGWALYQAFSQKRLEEHLGAYGNLQRKQQERHEPRRGENNTLPMPTKLGYAQATPIKPAEVVNGYYEYTGVPAHEHEVRRKRPHYYSDYLRSL